MYDSLQLPTNNNFFYPKVQLNRRLFLKTQLKWFNDKTVDEEIIFKYIIAECGKIYYNFSEMKTNV